MRQITAGDYHSCALMADGAVWCWGGGGPGSHQPKRVENLGRALQIDGGAAHNCALLADGGVACWLQTGNNYYGAIGRAGPATSGVAQHVPEVTHARRVTAGGWHSCALRRDGSVVCWGRNENAALGNGETRTLSGPVLVRGLPPAIDVSAGSSHSCAVVRGGAVWCWGSRGSGAFGAHAAEPQKTALQIPSIADAARVVAGSISTCAMRSGKQLSCWGSNAYGNLGIGAPREQATPRDLGLSDVSAVSVGQWQTCAAHANAVTCFGGSPATGPKRSTIAGFAQARELAGGFAHVCAVVGDEVRCVGDNFQGQLGIPAGTDRRKPRLVAGFQAGQLSARSFSCAVEQSGSVACWGKLMPPSSGRGGGITPPIFEAPTPKILGAFGGAKAVAVGGSHVCALGKDGSLSCLGDNAAGQLGIDEGWTPNPVVVRTIRNATAVDAGEAHTCVVLRDRSVQCFGSRAHGELGNGSGAHSRRPTAVPGVSDVSAISVGYQHACALRADRSVVCWGDNRAGQLGDGTKRPRSGAVKVPGVSAVHIACGGGDSCAVTTNGKVSCWGGSWRVPTPIAGIENAVSVAASGMHWCAALADGGLMCWGNNLHGQLGDGTATARTQPVRVPLSDVAWVELGDLYSCAAQKSGALHCWGDNSFGQLGVGSQEVAGEPATSSKEAVTVPLP